MTADQIRTAAANAGLGARADVIVSAALPSIRLQATPTTAALPGGASCLGGVPDLASRQTWPSAGGSPLAFVAQIDLASLRGFPASRDLPEAGLLSFFHDTAQEHWGFDPKAAGHFAVLYSPRGPYRRAEPPRALAPDATFVACGLTFHESLTLPPPDSAAFTELRFTPDEREKYFNMIDAIRERASFEAERGPGCWATRIRHRETCRRNARSSLAASIAATARPLPTPATASSRAGRRSGGCSCRSAARRRPG